MSETMNGRQECLTKAMEITSNDRNKDYGDPEDNFRDIAHIREITDKCNHPLLRVALSELAVKIARLANNPTHLDSWVDIAGYGACGYDIAKMRLAALKPVDVAKMQGVNPVVAPPNYGNRGEESVDVRRRLTEEFDGSHGLSVHDRRKEKDR